MTEQILWITDDDADDILWAEDGEPVECETPDGSLAILSLVANGLNPEKTRWEIHYDVIVRDQMDRLWMRSYSTPATEQQEGQERWTYDTKTRPDGSGTVWHSSKWVGFRPARMVIKTITDYVQIKEHK